MRSRRPPCARKSFSQPAELLIDEVVCLVDETDRDIGDHGRACCLIEADTEGESVRGVEKFHCLIMVDTVADACRHESREPC